MNREEKALASGIMCMSVQCRANLSLRFGTCDIGGGCIVEKVPGNSGLHCSAVMMLVGLLGEFWSPRTLIREERQSECAPDLQLARGPGSDDPARRAAIGARESASNERSLVEALDKDRGNAAFKLAIPPL